MDSRQNNTDGDRQKSLKGIHTNRMCVVIVAVSCILHGMLIAATVRISHNLDSTYRGIDDFVGCIQSESLLTDGSDYLTEQVRLYVVTKDRSHMDNYYTEVRETRRREKALDALEKYNLDADTSTYSYLQSALEKSNALMEREAYAMRLASMAQSLDAADLPKEVQDVKLSKKDQGLSPDAMQEKAQDMVFGIGYQEAKNQIISDVDYSLGSLNDIITQRMEDSNSSLKLTLHRQRVVVALLALGTLISYSFLILLVVLPIWDHIRRIKAGKPLEVYGSYECRYLARTCNVIFKRNADQAHMLRHQAEHDALTGLLNRGAFDSLEQELKGNAGPLGLLIIDVDKFKQVNDGYGHEMGDRVLKKVAELMKENFRSVDYPARIGGDEFAVILTDVTPDQQGAIAEKIAAMNKALTHPSEGLPEVSLSVGGAFSQNGFTDSLYKKADTALYEVKEHGRCGCRFYEG